MPTSNSSTDFPRLDSRRPWHALDRADVERELRTAAGGLTSDEAAARLAHYGPNELEEAPPTSTLTLILRQFKSPVIYFLLIATIIVIALEKYVDVVVILAVVVLNTVIGFTQERRAESSVRALTRLVAPHARVVRDGHEREIESREVVPGDLVLLESGSRVPADLRLVATTALQVDESLLTGESVPVVKRSAPVPEETPLADRTDMVYAGTVVSSGRGVGIAVATAGNTELGAIATQIREEAEGETPLQYRMARLSRLIAAAVALAAALAFAIGLARSEPVSEIFLVAVALAISVIPEGLPVATTITLAIGVRRMARKNAIIRRLPAVETLGSTTVIGSDKTGTLTENKMTVQSIWAGGRFTDLDGNIDHDAVAENEALQLTLLAGLLTNEAVAARTDDGWELHGDPTEAALLVSAERLGIDHAAARDAFPVVAEIPFEPDRQYSASVRERNGEHVIFVKGAPERILGMSERLLMQEGPVPLDPLVVQHAAEALAARGLRVLAMAYQVLPRRIASDEEIGEPSGLTFLGLQGMLDPPRKGVREAIADCRSAGIRVVMITGDHAATARAIGRDIGIGEGSSPVLTGVDLAALDENALRGIVHETSIYARVSPEQKHRVVEALRAEQEIVAVTGDGVNDAPALKAADIGIAMGRSGTDVTREAADMVLADDNFVSIVAAVEEGRIAFDNVRKVTYFLISVGAAEVLTILAALAIGWPTPLIAVQLIWLNLVTNGLQDVALAFEPGEPDVLKRKPRPLREGILSRLLWERTIVVAIVLALGTLGLFRWELDHSGSLAHAQTAALTTLVVFEAFQVGNTRSDTRSLFRMSPFSNRFLFIATAAALAVHVAALYFPPTQYVLGLEPLDARTWAMIVAVAVTILPVVELHKWLCRRHSLPGQGDGLILKQPQT